MLLLLLLCIFADVNNKNLGILNVLYLSLFAKSFILNYLATLVFLARHLMFKSSRSIVTMELLFFYIKISKFIKILEVTKIKHNF